MTIAPSMSGSMDASKRLFFNFLAILLLSLTACGDETEAEPAASEASPAVNTATAVIPPYTVVHSEVDGKDAKYRVQVGDTLPDEEQSIALARKVAGIENMPSVNTAVYITRAGFSALADAHAYVMFLNSEEKPSYKLQSSSNDRLKEIVALTFDSIPNKKLIFECLDAAGTKVFIYQKPAGDYIKVLVFDDRSYDIEPMKAEKNAQVFTKTEDDEKFTYKLNETGETMEVYNGNNSLLKSFRVLRKG